MSNGIDLSDLYDNMVTDGYIYNIKIFKKYSLNKNVLLRPRLIYLTHWKSYMYIYMTFKKIVLFWAYISYGVLPINMNEFDEILNTILMMNSFL